MDSGQLKMARAEWEANKEAIRARVLVEAEKYLDSEDELPYCCHDGFSDIMEPEGTYMRYTMDNGNDDDETCFIADIWCLTLAQEALRVHPLDGERRVKLLTLICKFLDINVNGL